jgi:hypothetical protein
LVSRNGATPKRGGLSWNILLGNLHASKSNIALENVSFVDDLFLKKCDFRLVVVVHQRASFKTGASFIVNWLATHSYLDYP